VTDREYPKESQTGFGVRGNVEASFLELSLPQSGVEGQVLITPECELGVAFAVRPWSN
jgi:hypothetical protein